jgi:hypothetical protein
MLQAIQTRLLKPAGALAVAFALLLGGCGKPETLSEDQLAALEDRVYARWQTKMAREFDKTWEFSTPAYRAAFPQKLYRFGYSYAVEWELTGIEVLDYHADAAVASVAVRVMSKPTKLTSSASRAVGAVPVTFVEQWILIDGQWWYSANS